MKDFKPKSKIASVDAVRKHCMSKREQDRLNKQKRQMWEFSPVTRVKESKKNYKRNNKHEYDYDEML